MRKVLLGLFYALLGLLLVFIAGGYALPGKVHVERQAVINAAPEKVFAVVSDLQRSKDWSPWFGIDPNMKVSFEGPGGNLGPGVGQKMSWTSTNPNVGSGWQEVTEFVADKKVVAVLNFGDMGKATASVHLDPEGTGTKVTWGFDTTLNSMAERWFGLLFDRWIGADYEKGLNSLKAFVEKQG